MGDLTGKVAVITGSGVNYDGKTNGITAPSGAAQTRLLKSIYEKFGIDPEMIDYIVTHGTGTRLGDPVEVNALADALGIGGKRKHPCALTSTKTNFGHAMAGYGCWERTSTSSSSGKRSATYHRRRPILTRFSPLL